MKVKELQKTVSIAWSPLQQQPIYLAAGTAAQQLDSSAQSALEIYSTNLGDPSYDLELKASLAGQYRFQKLIWSSTGWDGAHRNGLLVGGCEGGHVMIYSASRMLANEEDGVIIARQDKHTGVVTGLDVNEFQKNLLATCASESEIFIWDMNNMTTHMSPGVKTQPLEDVKSVAWNRQVQHILASVFSTRCVIWDLRKSEQIIKLSDTQSRVRWHAVQWHPDIATQVWLASEDDQAPVVQLWDLRYATAPTKTMQIHQRGMLGMSWCPRDIDLMVSCGKDNRIYCWNPNTEQPDGEILSEVATTATWYSDVQWCPRNPALIASSSLDGNVSIYSLFGGTQQQVQTSNKIADSFPGMEQLAQAPMSQQATNVVYNDLKRAPKWIKRPCGAAWGFGGKLISFNGNTKTVSVSQVVTEPELVERANVLQNSMAEIKYAEYCRQRADQSKDPEGRYLWYFIKANFEVDPKEEMLNLLGYNREDTEQKFAKYVKNYSIKCAPLLQNGGIDQITKSLSILPRSDSSECEHSLIAGSTDASPEDGGALFDDIAADVHKQQEAANIRPKFKIPSGEHADSLITEAILTGNLEAAVTLCLESQRTTEALIIASTAGIEFLTRIQEHYLRQRESEGRSRELASIISALVERDWMDFVQRCTIDSWKEALVAALRHSDRKAADICEHLGNRLLEEGGKEYVRHSMICYVCAGNLDKLVTAWYRLKQHDQRSDNGDGVDSEQSLHLSVWELQELAELTLLMSKSLEQQGISLDLDGRFASFIGQYGELLASQGALTAALSYILALCGGANDAGVVGELRDRIYSTVHGRQTPGLTYGAAPLSQGQQQATKIYGRQQRSSFSQSTIPPIPGPYGSILQSQLQPPQNVFQPPQGQFPLGPPTQNTMPLMHMVPTVFNPSTMISQSTMPPMKPPTASDAQTSTRPPSTGSSQGGVATGAPVVTTGSGLLNRSKYVRDPSVVSPGVGPMAGGYGGMGGGFYNPHQTTAVMPMTGVPPSEAGGFNNNTFGGVGPPTRLTSQPMSTMMPQPMTFNSMPFGGVSSGNQSYMDSGVGGPPPPIQNIQRNPTPPPGWNDPPALKSNRQSKPVQDVASTIGMGPITHPLLGVDPNLNPNPNGYYDPNTAYQVGGGMSPPPQISSASTAQPPIAYPNASTLQSNNNALVPPAMGSGTYVPPNSGPAIGGFQTGPPQQQQWNTQSIGYAEQPAPVEVVRKQTEPPKKKPPLPEEYIYMQTVLEELKTQCLAAASEPRMKRKFVDVTKRLENLYDCLRDGRLSMSTITALNQIVQYIQIGDYGNAMQTQTQLAFGADFSQCAGFMPGLKVLVQSAADLQLYLR